MNRDKPPNINLKMECRQLCVVPCLKVLIFTTIAQLFLLTVFIAFVNCNIFHPLQWLFQLFGFHWIKHIPLIGILLLNGLILIKTLLTGEKFYSNRFKWLKNWGLIKLMLLVAQLMFGLVTAWSFMSYLRQADSTIFIERNGLKYINSRHTFLTFIGLASGFYHFVRKYARHSLQLEFEYIPKPVFIQLRESLLRSVWKSAKDTFLSTICLTGVYWLCGGILNRRLASLFGVNVDDQMDNLFSVLKNVTLLLYAWLIAIELFTVMSLMQQAFSIFLTREFMFPISKSLDETQVTLVSALSMSDVPVIQKLAALDFYNLTKIKSPARRSEIFTLSQPGGHPYNWNQLSNQCLSLINAYASELDESLKTAANVMQPVTSHNISGSFQPSATELAQRILIRQYNEMHSIRRLKSEIHTVDQNISQPTSTVARINANFDKTTQEIKQRIINIFRSLPGLYYMFGEPSGARTAYILSNSDVLIWLVQGLAYVCVASLSEDPYGVVQMTLPEIVKTLLKLRTELEKLSSLSLNSKKMDPNLMPLRNALKRSLHKICNAFAEYLPEIVEDPSDLPYLRTFLYQPAKC